MIARLQAWLATHALALVGGVALVLAVAAGVQSLRVSRLKSDVETARARVLQAQVQAALSDKVLRIEDRRHTIETRIVGVANEEAAALREADDGRTALAPGLRDRWLRAVERVRAASEPATDDPGAGDASSAVSAP